MKIFKRISLIFFCSIVLLVAFALGYREIQKGKRERQMLISKDGVDETHYLNIGGVKQWINIRGQDKTKPIVLFIDGGPGKPSTSYLHLFQLELEKDVIVVHWEQRGSAKSFNETIPIESMNVSQFISDGIEVSDFLRNRLNKNKIFLLGHSWGSMLGALIANRAPEKYYAFIGFGQVVSIERGWAHTWEKFNKLAEVENNLVMKKSLSEISPPPWNTKEQWQKFFWLQVERGCEIYGKKNYTEIMIEMIYSPLYSIADHVDWVKGQAFSQKYLEKEIRNIDLAETVLEYNLPVYFLVGKHDCNTPFELTEEYFNKLKSPRKKIFWFENSSHSLSFEEPILFQKTIIEIIMLEKSMQLE